MYRFIKFIWILFTLWIVFFIIFDEKNNFLEPNIVSNSNLWTISTVDYAKNKNADLIKLYEWYGSGEILKASRDDQKLYKNSSLIRLYSGFWNPIFLAKWIWVDVWFISTLHKSNYSDKVLTNVDSWNPIYGLLTNRTNFQSVKLYEWSIHNIQILKARLSGDVVETWEVATNLNLHYHNIKLLKWINKSDSEVKKIDAYKGWSHVIVLWKGIEKEKSKVSVQIYDFPRISIALSKWIKKELPRRSVNPYEKTNIGIKLYKGAAIVPELSFEDIKSLENARINAELMEQLFVDDNIDVNSLESENDEFLQKVFEETLDPKVMNLIVETYLDEYQFVKAKKFIESLSGENLSELDPVLNLRVTFNSFQLSSDKAEENLNLVVQSYKSQNKISIEDSLRYQWVLALMQKDYTQFLELASGFKTENHKAFSEKIQDLKDQTDKQMWMPKYYLDTLVSVELFNQWFFQPAKVLALSSLAQNTKYILPYQVLAYANFLTNSRDTSIEYLKKLVDLDPNNAEKYRFLMWIAYYRDEKYEQSVLMLSMIKNEKLRLDAERYLIRNYVILDQKNKLISSRSRILWYENLTSSDFYTYFYEAFFHPYSEWKKFEIYAYDRDLAEKMLRVCNIRLQWDENVVCTYGYIWKNISLWEFDNLEQSLLQLVRDYPQWYLYHALGEYYLQQEDLDKAKLYLLKAAGMSQTNEETSQLKIMLQNAMS